MQKEITNNVCEEKFFSNIYYKYSKDLLGYLYYKFGSQASNDNIQEAFIKLWDHCKKITPSKAKAFLFRVANNVTLNEIKHQKVVLNFVQNTPKDYTNESPEFLMEEKEFLKRYQIALSKLKPEERAAFLLNKAEGKRHKEIADMLGVSRRVVEHRIYTAYKKLKNEVEGFR